jgi:hypothetical protein
MPKVEARGSVREQDPKREACGAHPWPLMQPICITKAARKVDASSLARMQLSG